MNILLLSVGTRNKIVQYFKRELGDQGRVIATDMIPLAPAVYEADSFYQMPRITDPQYIDMVLEICRKEQITGVLSLIDPELSLLAANQERFEELGVTVIGSSRALCEMALDKVKMYTWLRERGYRCAKSYDTLESFYRDLDRGEICFPVIVKPVRGSASLSVYKLHDRQTLELHWSHHKGLMIQQLLQGQEIGADCYIDLVSGELVSAFTKEKILMRAGETDKSVSFQDPALFELLQRFSREAGWRGQIDVDLFACEDGYYISEVNPRFGGGYPHAYECGCNHMKLIVQNLRGQANPSRIGCYESGIAMMKYSEIMLRKCTAE